MMGFIRRTLHPAWYHGHGKKAPYFEGWYFKLVTADEAHRWAVIPGVYLAPDPAKSHSFVQVLDGVARRMTYREYPLETFRTVPDGFDVLIGPNHFTLHEIEVNVETDEYTFQGQVAFENLIPWPVTWTSPGVMGWYAWVPFMETYHGVLSFDHRLRGALQVDDERFDLSGGRGYIEKDWGKSFPSAWIWLQTNHFDQPGTSLMASTAMIPWLGSSFRGFIIGLWHGGRLYRFATYTGARVDRIEIAENRVHWIVQDRAHRLEMTAVRTEATILRGPSRVDMGIGVPETLNARVRLRLSNRAGELIFEGEGRHAGMEVAGDWQQLIDGQ
jgi:hypothetical protein